MTADSFGLLPVPEIAEAPPAIELDEGLADFSAGGDATEASAVPLVAMNHLLDQLRFRADDVLTTQGRLRGLLRANAVLASDLSLPSLLHSLAEEACRLLQAQFAAIVVMGANDRMEALVQVGMPAALLEKVQGHPSWREISDLLAPTATDGEQEQPTGYGSEAPDEPTATGFLELPVRMGKKVYGRLYLRTSAGAAFTDEDEQIVSALAATAGVALANASLFGESEQRHRWLLAASALANDLLSSKTARPLEMVCQYALRASYADFVTVTLPDQTYVVSAPSSAGPLAEQALSHLAKLRDDAQLTLETGTPQLFNDFGDDAVPSAGDVRVGSVMVVPLVAGDHAEGAMTVGRVAGRTEFSEADLTMTSAFATQAAVALAFNAARQTEMWMARLEDRDRIAMDLHDHVIQELFAVGMGLEGLSGVLDAAERTARVGSYVNALNNTISTLRTRIFQLQPNRHAPRGLQTQLLELADAQTEQLGYAPQLHFSGSLDSSVDGPLADDMLAVTREALSNCARHAHATSVTVVVALLNGRLMLTITDDGIGIRDTTRSSGLTNMRRRAERHGGTCTVSTPTTGGTRVTWTACL
jgi:signal transduction histidine kinase